MAKFRLIHTDFWKNPIVLEEMSPEDKLFYLYLLTNANTTQIGIYKITKKQMAFDLGFSMESVQTVMDRFIHHHKVIRYNPVTRELAIRNWGKDNLYRAGKPVMDCITSELKEVEDTSLIQYVSEPIQKQEIRSLYISFCEQVRIVNDQEVINQHEDDTYLETVSEELEDVMPTMQPENQQQKALDQDIAYNSTMENPLKKNQQDVKEIIGFWDDNGFGFTHVNAKQQLLSWLDDSSFLQPKEMILKAMNIACANNKRRLSYVIGILKNWENESLLTIEEVDSYHENQKPVFKHRQTTQTFPAGRAIPVGFVLDLTAGEE
ncbi:DnaD domain protein [Bacillus sp. EB106-08-02-XG196]|uniref:DnaD domain protein n=1 Tax=Bacillus sp. EB106-08-02-XG196 TaxID=2737049 RepID=UPI0015C492E4|nr:DnaD domain protein [Bacillus sp. EB106-08-02-XG196]NWQ42797.1 DnaD domain protein [Bacillus sp. EB106-08-02-XG196]